MKRRLTGTVGLSLLVAGALALAPVAATPAAAAGHAHKHAAAKPCYDSAIFKGRRVRVPTNCHKSSASEMCYLQSRFHGRTYRRRIDCGQANKPVTAGSSATTAPSDTPASATGSTGATGAAGVGSYEGINWATSSAASCDDGSTPTGTSGYFSCNDTSWPYCAQGTDFVVIDPENQNVACLPNASVPTSGVCDDGSQPGSGGTEADGTPICTDGDDAFLPGDRADDSASQGSCDDNSSPGDGGTDSSGNLLCADGSYPHNGL